MNWTLHATLVLILLLAASIARAGGTVGFDPAYPSAGAPFRIHVWSGPCAYLSESPTAATIVSPATFVRGLKEEKSPAAKSVTRAFGCHC